MTGYVYAVGADDLVKIGWSGNPKRRFESIRTGNAGHCRLLGYIPATMAQEQELHKLLEPWRVRREWFTRSPAVEYFLARLTPPIAPPSRRNAAQGNLIQQRRIAAGMTRKRLGEQIGVHALTIYRWETDRIVPGRKQWLALHRALGIEIADILHLVSGEAA